MNTKALVLAAVTAGLFTVAAQAAGDANNKQPQESAPRQIQRVVASVERESEHPPLQTNTKQAIAEYKQRPTEANKAKLLKVMNENYDAIIQLKKDNLAKRVRDREKNINHWMQAVRSGEVPPFMKLNTENHKGNERKAIADAVDTYRKDPSSKNEDPVRKSLNAYYDVFLDEAGEAYQGNGELP